MLFKILILVIGMNLEVINHFYESIFIAKYNCKHYTIFDTLENKTIIYLAKGWLTKRSFQDVKGESIANICPSM